MAMGLFLEAVAQRCSVKEVFLNLISEFNKRIN